MMKQLLLTFCIILISTLIYAQDSVDLMQYIQTHELLLEDNRLNDKYPESRILFYTDKQNSKFILCSGLYDYFAIGNLGGESKLLIDMSGNGIADTLYDSVNIPFWIMSKNSIKSSSNQNILNDLNAMFKAFGMNQLIRRNPLYISVMDHLSSSLREKEYENRDIYYLIYLHSVSHNRDSVWSQHAIDELDKQLRFRYGLDYTHPTIMIFNIEYSIKMDYLDRALLLNSEMLKKYPNHSVFRLYDYMINNIDYSQIPTGMFQHRCHSFL